MKSIAEKRAILVVQNENDPFAFHKGYPNLKFSVNQALRESVSTLGMMYAERGQHSYVQPIEISNVISCCSEQGVALDEIVQSNSHHKTQWPKLRTVLDFDVDTTMHNGVLGHTGTTHLILARPRNGRPQAGFVWRSTNNGTVAEVTLNKHHLECLIHDQFLDIAMVMSWPKLFSQVKQSLSNEEFNRKKWEFVMNRINNGAVCPYSSIFGKDPTYVSIAAICRSSAGNKSLSPGECEVFDEAWREFLSGIIELPEPLPYYRQDAINQINRHLPKKFGQLSKRKLKAQLEILKPGNYLLFVASRKPEHEKTISYVARTLLRRYDVEWKKNQFRVFSENEARQHARLHEWCDVIPIVVSKG